MKEPTDSNVPQIRFKGFAEEWAEFTLDNLGVATSGTSIESEFKSNGIFKVISIGSYAENSTYTDQGIRVDLTNKTRERVLNEGDLTMVLNDKTASGRIIGRVLLIPTGHAFIYNQRTQRIEPYLDKFLPNFLYQLLNAPLIRLKIINQSQGNTQIYVNWSSIKKSIYLLPKLEEQTQIGGYFREVDRLIGLQQRKHDKLVTLKKAMLHAMFPQPGTTTPEIRFKGFSGEWVEKKLGELCEIVGGGTPSTAIREYWGGDIDWYSPTEIGDEVYASGSVKKITQVGLTKCSAKMLPPRRTILFTSRAGIGDMAILIKEGCTNQGFQSLVLYDDVDPYFMFSMGHLIKCHALKYASGSTFLEVSSKQLGKMEVLLPNEKEQQKIGTYFRTLDSLISQHAIQLQKLKQLKSACLEKMFV